ncbi:hypothetical protein OQA88_7093 [Cercophora sp. LCS_1]
MLIVVQGKAAIIDVVPDVSAIEGRSDIPFANVKLFGNSPHEIPSQFQDANDKVISAFIAAAGFSILSTALCLLLSRRAEGDATHPDYDAHTQGHQRNPVILPTPPNHFNPIDRFFRNNVCKRAQHLVRRASGDPAILGACFRDSVLALGDQQIVTGIAMMIAAIVRKNDPAKPLSTYHFVVISDLVWFCSNAHLLALLVIRSYDDSAKRGSVPREDETRRKRSARATRTVRAVLMTALAGFLVYASILADDVYLFERFACPAACLDTSDDGSGGEPRTWMIVNIFYVFYNYPLAILMLSRSLRKRWMGFASESIHRVGGLEKLQARLTDAVKPQLVNLPGGKVLQEAENSWGFGQVVPWALLFLPFMQFMESYATLS